MATKIGTIIDGKYEILKQIGKGGMSIVYLAMDKRLNKQWAVKEIRKTASAKNDEIIVNSLLAEANLMKKLDHPALPRIVDIIDNGETLYVIMDYIEGESLDKIISEFGAQPEDLVINWSMQICDALDYLHSQKPPIIYRDMKPANIMLKPEGNVKIIDFGIAREYKEKNLADTTVLGTKGYASPEHYGSRQTDPRSDIYTLGMTMHHLLTGIDPRTPDYNYAPVRQWNPMLSEGIEEIVNKCTQLDPDDRYKNCAELMYDLQHSDQIGKGVKHIKKRRLKLFLASAILSILMVLTGVFGVIMEKQVNNNDYKILVDKGNYFDAMEIDGKGDDIQAYNEFLTYVTKESEGSVSKDDFNRYKGNFKKNFTEMDGKNRKLKSADYSEIAYYSGFVYYTYYINPDDKADKDLQKANEASVFFEWIANTGKSDYLDVAKSFKILCENYISFNKAEDISKKDITNLIKGMNKLLDSNVTGGLEKKDENIDKNCSKIRLNVCNSFVVCLKNYSIKVKDYISSDEIISLLESIETKFNEFYEKSSKNEYYKELKKVFENNCKSNEIKELEGEQ